MIKNSNLSKKQLENLKKIWNEKGRNKNRYSINFQWILLFIVVIAVIVFTAVKIGIYFLKLIQH